MAIKNIKLFAVPVSDQDVAEDFYVTKLGLEKKNNKLSDEQRRWVEVGPRGSENSITLVTWSPLAPSEETQDLIIESNDIGEDVKRITARGVRFNSEIQKRPWGSFVTLSDPDGNNLVLQQTTNFMPA